MIRPWVPLQTPTDTKGSTRDPRLNRTGPPPTAPPKDQLSARKDGPHPAGTPAITAEKKTSEKPSRLERARPPRKDVVDEKSKSLTPMAKNVLGKSKVVEMEHPKSSDGLKKDPRLRKRSQDKTGDNKEDETKDKKRCGDKKERDEARGPEPSRSNKAKLLNGSVTKHEREDAADKLDLKSGGNARTHARKRSRSRSPTSSPKRKDRRSPKTRARSSSLSPSPSHKPGKPRRVRLDEPQHGKLIREDRTGPKKIQSDRRTKRPADERHPDSREPPRGHDGGKETKETPHRWRSGWEDNKQ